MPKTTHKSGFAQPRPIPSLVRAGSLRCSDLFIDSCQPWYAGVATGVMLRAKSAPGSRDHESAVAPKPVHPRPWAPRGIVAPSGIVGAAVDGHPLLPGCGAAGRG